MGCVGLPELSEQLRWVGGSLQTLAIVGGVVTYAVTRGRTLSDQWTHTRVAYRVPAMAKDFIVEPCQICQARCAGAGGVLLILRILDDVRLTRLLELSLDFGMFVVLEAFDEGDLDRAGRLVEGLGDTVGNLLVGLNSRDLSSLKVDSDRLRHLASAFPAGLPRVAESGLHDAVDVAGAAASGYSLALVGTALMRAQDPGQCLSEMIAAGRRVACGGRT